MDTLDVEDDADIGGVGVNMDEDEWARCIVIWGAEDNGLASELNTRIDVPQPTSGAVKDAM